MKIYCSLILSLLVITAAAQQKPTDVDKSPLDVSYCPPNYPILKMNGSAKELPVARVIYSRPQKNGRTIFDGIVKYGEIWRMGANEATEIEFFRNVKFGGKPIAKGRYTMYAVCNELSWTIILNTENYVWGLAYDDRKDALRIDIPVQKNVDDVDALTMYFDNGNVKTGSLNILWEKTKVSIPVVL